MLPNPDCLSNLLGLLYDAASDSTMWEAFLRELARASEAQSAAVVLHDRGNSDHTVARAYGLDPNFVGLYSNYYGKIDLWAKRFVELSKLERKSWCGAGEQLCPHDELVRTEYYNDFLAPQDLPHAMFGTISHNEDATASVSVYRSSRAGPFSTSRVDLLRFLEPHITRAFRLHLHLANLNARIGGLESALNDMATGVFLLGECGEVIVANRSASATLSQTEGLTVVKGKLSAQKRDESAMLQRLIGQAVGSSVRRCLRPIGATSVSRIGKPPLQLLIAPMKRSLFDMGQSVAAIVFVTDPSTRLRPAQEILLALFRLTPAECRVAMLLTDGHSVRQIGQLLGVTTNTLKSQLASIYLKTGTSRQSQVVRLISQLPLHSAA
jgi:DNA-binding CsgD family transcriptional regulator/PAS domain-containing protein